MQSCQKLGRVRGWMKTCALPSYRTLLLRSSGSRAVAVSPPPGMAKKGPLRAGNRGLATSLAHASEWSSRKTYRAVVPSPPSAQRGQGSADLLRRLLSTAGSLDRGRDFRVSESPETRDAGSQLDMRSDGCQQPCG